MLVFPLDPTSFPVLCSSFDPVTPFCLLFNLENQQQPTNRRRERYYEIENKQISLNTNVMTLNPRDPITLAHYSPL